MKMTEILFSQLAKLRCKGHIVSIQHLNDLQEEIENDYSKDSFDEGFYKERLSSFMFSPPDSLLRARSLIVVAAPQPQFQVTFNWSGESHSFIIPPTYLYYSDRQLEDVLTGILSPKGYHVDRTVLPLKLLAVHSGLGRYGKNNICYVPGMGSFHRLVAFYTDLPCPEDTWQEAQVMEDCENCSACLCSCPTGAISSDRFLLRAEKCISFHNERAGDFPKWINPSWHNALVGCLCCQRVCLLNKPFLQWVENKGKFSQEETALLMEGKPLDRLPSALAIRLEQLDLIEYLNVLPRNLSVLLDKEKHS